MSLSYTKAETARITEAYKALATFLDARSHEHMVYLEECISGEIRQSRSNHFQTFTKAEARLYVLRQIRDAMRDHPQLSPADLYGFRPTLARAYCMGAALAARYGRDHGMVLLQLQATMDDAALAHDQALGRSRDKALRDLEAATQG